MITAKLVLFVNGTYRRTSPAALSSQEEADDLRTKVTQLQQFFDINIEISYVTEKRAKAGKRSSKGAKPVSDNQLSLF